MRLLSAIAVLGCLILGAGFIGCTGGEKSESILITTTSVKARDYFLEGRDLADRHRISESRAFFQLAIEEDPYFALVHLYLAGVQPSARALFASFDRAKALSGRVSDGEQLCILGFEAGRLVGDLAGQIEIQKQLVTLYSNDERAHYLLGNCYFGQQNWEMAIAEYVRSNEINPSFPCSYNQLGYAFQYSGKYDESAAAFRKYIELIPNDPNPYDSYAELLMKMGRFGESIETYRRALEIDTSFVASYLGIASNLSHMDRSDLAQEQLDEMYSRASDDDLRRRALQAKAVCYVDEGSYDKALIELDKQLELARLLSDTANMSADLTVKGTILIEAGYYDRAQAAFDRAKAIIEASSLSEPVKDLTRASYMWNTGRILAARGDFDGAQEYRKQFAVALNQPQNSSQIKLSFELKAIIALQEHQWDEAIESLRQSNMFDPYNLYRLGLAFEGRGETDSARVYFTQAADFNARLSLPYACVRTKAKQKVASLDPDLLVHHRQ